LRSDARLLLAWVTAMSLGLFLTGCSFGGHGGGGGGGGGGNSHDVTVGASPGTTVTAGTAVTLTLVSVLNDPSNGGVTWNLQPPTGKTGSFSSTSATSATFTPAFDGSITPFTWVVVATSKDFPNFSENIDITVDPPAPVISSIAPTSVAANSGQFQLTINGNYFESGGSGGTIHFGSTSVTANPTSATQFVINVPNSAIETPGTVNVQVTNVDGQASNTKPFTVGAQSSPITFSPGVLPSATVGAAYSESVTVAGGAPPYTYTITNVPAGLAATHSGSSVTIAGMPTTASQSNPPLTIAVTDSASATASIGYTLLIAASGGSACPLFGQYAFLMTGYDAHGAYVMAGSVYVDANGGILSGIADFKATTTASNPNSGLAVSGTCTSGTAAQTGSLALSFSSNTISFSHAFAFVMRSDDTQGRIIEADTGVTGVAVSGVIELQNPSAYAQFGGGDFAFGMAGEDSSGNRLAIAGDFCSFGSGANGDMLPYNISTLHADVNGATGALPEFTLTSGLPLIYSDDGSYAPGRFPLPNFGGGGNSPITLGSVTLNLMVYEVDGDRAFAIDIGSTAANPIVAVEFERQGGIRGCAESYSNSSVKTSVSSSWGAVSGATQTSLGRIFNINAGAGTASFSEDLNANGTFTTTGGTPFAATYSVESNGRGSFTFSTGGGPHTAHFYLYGNAGDAFFVDSDPDIGFGFVHPQNPSSSIAQPSGTFAFGTIFSPAPAAAQVIGQITVSGTSLSGSAGGVSASGTITYDVDFASTGRGTTTISPSSLASSNLVFYVINPKLIVAMGMDNVTDDNIGFLGQ
jgi:IPT/TIG domain